MVAVAVPGLVPGGDAKDFLAWLAPYLALVVLALGSAQAAGLVVLGAGTAIYFVSRADLEHAQGLLVVAAALAAFVRPPVGATALTLLILSEPRTGRRVAAPAGPEPYGRFGCRPRGRRAAATRPRPALVPPGDPIYVTPLRSDLVTFSNPLLYRLVHRPNVLRRDVLLQAKPEEQQNIVRRRRAQPR